MVSEQATHSGMSGPNAVRWWPLAAIGSVAALALAWIWLFADLARGWAVVYTGQTIFFTLIGLLVWLAFFSRLKRRIRGVGLAIILVPIAAAIALLRIDAVSGDLVPHLAWRFARKPHERLAPLAARDQAAVADLSIVTPSDYPQYLGPRRDAMLSDVRLDRDWNAHPPQLVWKQPIGGGWSSFSSVGDYALTQEQRGPHELVTCYELKTGKLLWSYADEVYYESKVGGDGPRATPTIVDGRVYTMGSTGLLNCLKGDTGERIWQRDVFQDTSSKNADWGKACSPLVVEDQVIVTGGAERGPTLVSYRTDTGDLIWKADDQPTARQSYGSPMLAQLAGVPQVLMLNDNTLAGYDLASGKQLWEHPWPGSEPKVTQPLVLGENRVVVASGYGVGTALLEISANDAGKLSAREVWANRNFKPKFTNAVHRDGFLYGLDEGILVCLDLNTGERRWKKGRYNHGQIMLVGDTILVLAEDGAAVLVEATPEAHRELARFQVLDGKTWGHPAIAPPYLLVRNDHEAACYKLTLD